MRIRTWIIVACLFITAFNSSLLATVYRVDHAVSGGTGDGLSWANACSTVDHGLSRAGYHDEIWVTNGLYYHDSTQLLRVSVA